MRTDIVVINHHPSLDGAILRALAEVSLSGSILRADPIRPEREPVYEIKAFEDLEKIRFPIIPSPRTRGKHHGRRAGAFGKQK